MTECVISHASLDLGFKVWKMYIKNMGLIQWFSNFTLPSIYLWSCSPLLSCFENVWLNYEKKHHLYLASAIKS